MPGQQQLGWGDRLAWLVATGFGVGSARVAPGTFGTLLGVPIYLLLYDLQPAAYVVAVALLFAGGSWACSIAERVIGVHDDASMICDEVVGFLITLFLAPAGWVWLVIGFLLFRLFDIWKPYPIDQIDRRVPGGVGTMLDDAWAGVYAWVTLQAIAYALGASPFL